MKAVARNDAEVDILKVRIDTFERVARLRIRENVRNGVASK